MSRAPRIGHLAAALLLAVPMVACGKKGPPLPPLVRMPAAPADVKADRRGLAVDVQFQLPAANVDGSRPANIQRVEIFALNGPAPASEREVLTAGVRVGAVEVKAPRDPDETVDADEPDSDVDPLEGPGLDQGAVAHVRELLTDAMLASGASTRTYVGVGITTRGRRGTVSTAVAVTLGVAPGAPAQPAVSYDETTITVRWAPLGNQGQETEAPLAYHVYDVSPPDPAAAASPAAGATGPTRLTEAPVDQTHFDDARITWNAERCYAVRAVRRYDELAVEGDASPERCTLLMDTFAPASPSGMTAVASEGAINLIWTPNAERDLAGYQVLRAMLPAGELAPITPTPITESSFTDTVQAGVRYAYAVRAIDTAGNVSADSDRVEETAR